MIPTFLTPSALPIKPLPRYHSLTAPKICATAAPADGAEKTPAYSLAPGEVGVRFINTPSGKDVIAAAHPGDPLLSVGDSVGIHIPRQCQSGLCASCTCDMIDPNVEDGRQTIRACQTGVTIPEGGDEMVIDVERMKSFSGKRMRDPMARFDNLDTDYIAGAAPKGQGTWLREVNCTECSSTGDIECYACDGEGFVEGLDCLLCATTGSLRCADCQGTGIRQIRR